jgi:hypothetical protein
LPIFISVTDVAVNWLVSNARSFSYILPDILKLALYLSLAAYFGRQIAQQKV